MTSKFTELCVDCRDPHTVATFWSEVLGYSIKTEDDEIFIEGPPGSGPTILFAKVPEEKVVKNRLHIDVNPIDRDQEEEVERLEKLGATTCERRPGRGLVGGHGRSRGQRVLCPEKSRFAVARWWKMVVRILRRLSTGPGLLLMCDLLPHKRV